MEKKKCLFLTQILSWGDLVTDYNIYQDYHYKLTVNIAGPNSADLRVTITNGNVAVFDDVDNVENTVNFGEEK